MKIVATTSFAGSRPPERRPLERRTLAPKDMDTLLLYLEGNKVPLIFHILISKQVSYNNTEIRVNGGSGAGTDETTLSPTIQGAQKN